MLRTTIQSIELRDLTYVNEKGRVVFSHVNFKFPMGEIVWLKDENGVGRSVLAKMLCGLLMPTSGDLLINGLAVNEMTFEEFVPFRCNMGYSFDFGGLINNRDIMGNLLLATEYHGVDFGDPDRLVERIMKYMEEFDLKGVAYERPSALAGSQRKAACVARAFVHEPELLLLDDPTTGLRADAKLRLKNLILLKRASGEVRHAFIASEDIAFMNSLNPKIIEISNESLHVVDERGAA